MARFKVGDRVRRLTSGSSDRWEAWVEKCRGVDIDPYSIVVVTRINKYGDPIIGAINEYRWDTNNFKLAIYQSQEEIDNAITALINS